MEILRTEGLKKVYGSGENAVHALDGVSLSVEKGEFAAIVGTSGSGKSTLLHMLGGLDRPTEGSVFVDGKDIFSLKDEEFTSLFTIVLSINSSYEMYTFRRIGGCCHGTFKDVSAEQAAAISGHPKVKEAGERIVLGCMEKGEFARIPAEVSFMDENCAKWSFAEPEQGHFPEGAKEITMDDQALRLLGIVPGIGVSVPLTYTFVDNKGISYEKTDTFILAGC